MSSRFGGCLTLVWIFLRHQFHEDRSDVEFETNLLTETMDIRYEQLVFGPLIHLTGSAVVVYICTFGQPYLGNRWPSVLRVIWHFSMFREF